MAERKQPGKSAANQELVDFYAFKDGGKYKDDIVVIINGKALRIKRGVHVRIPKNYRDVLEQSMDQDVETANMIADLSSQYQAEAKARNV